MSLAVLRQPSQIYLSLHQSLSLMWALPACLLWLRRRPKPRPKLLPPLLPLAAQLPQAISPQRSPQLQWSSQLPQPHPQCSPQLSEELKARAAQLLLLLTTMAALS